MDNASPPWAGRPDSVWSDGTILPDGCTDPILWVPHGSQLPTEGACVYWCTGHCISSDITCFYCISVDWLPCLISVFSFFGWGYLNILASCWFPVISANCDYLVNLPVESSISTIDMIVEDCGSKHDKIKPRNRLIQRCCWAHMFSLLTLVSCTFFCADFVLNMSGRLSCIHLVIVWSIRVELLVYSAAPDSIPFCFISIFYYWQSWYLLRV